eukprot:GEMP01001632.1.p1 GENE.GEMP01001632.1~~GEMP01001632.1.p1  ORF type:complete len:1090 (+),score=221.68 GEMP01001632.1:901-4170(+)
MPPIEGKLRRTMSGISRQLSSWFGSGDAQDRYGADAADGALDIEAQKTHPDFSNAQNRSRKSIARSGSDASQPILEGKWMDAPARRSERISKTTVGSSEGALLLGGLQAVDETTAGASTTASGTSNETQASQGVTRPKTRDHSTSVPRTSPIVLQLLPRTKSEVRLDVKKRRVRVVSPTHEIGSESLARRGRKFTTEKTVTAVTRGNPPASQPVSRLSAVAGLPNTQQRQQQKNADGNSTQHEHTHSPRSSSSTEDAKVRHRGLHKGVCVSPRKATRSPCRLARLKKDSMSPRMVQAPPAESTAEDSALRKVPVEDDRKTDSLTSLDPSNKVCNSKRIHSVLRRDRTVSNFEDSTMTPKSVPKRSDSLSVARANIESHHGEGTDKDKVRSSWSRTATPRKANPMIQKLQQEVWGRDQKLRGGARGHGPEAPRGSERPRTASPLGGNHLLRPQRPEPPNAAGKMERGRAVDRDALEMMRPDSRLSDSDSTERDYSLDTPRPCTPSTPPVARTQLRKDPSWNRSPALTCQSTPKSSPRSDSATRTKLRMRTDSWLRSATPETPRTEMTPRMRLRTESWVGRGSVMESEEWVHILPRLTFTTQESCSSARRSTSSSSGALELPKLDSDGENCPSDRPPVRKKLMDCDWFSELQKFVRSTSARDIMQHFARFMSLLNHRRKTDFPFKLLPSKPWQSKRLREHLNRFVAKWQSLESRKAKNQLQMFIIGAGPVGLRTAIAAAVNRYKVGVWEKRDSFSRINRLHLWDFVGRDLIELNAKLFDCEGSNFATNPDFMHIGIGELQALLLKNALLLGVDVKFKYEYVGTQVQEKGWLVTTRDLNCPEVPIMLNADVLIGCDGCNSVVVDLIGKYIKVEMANATGLVANFVNAGTNAPRQFSMARQYFVPTFKQLEDESGAQLENIVYYRGNLTHYFVMTCTKKSLIQFGAIDSQFNVTTTKLKEYARNVCKFFGMPEEELTFVGGPQACAVFDFSTTTRCDTPVAFHANDTAAAALVGDALMEPFWPEGLGCIRGFFSGFDCIAALDTWQTEGAVAAREQALASYKNLKNINVSSKESVMRKDASLYGIHPKTRYRR